MAIYENQSGTEGHVGLVISTSGSGNSGAMDTIEGLGAYGRHPVRGVFLHVARPWGDGKTIGYDKNTLVYKGCVMPWKGLFTPRRKAPDAQLRPQANR